MIGHVGRDVRYALRLLRRAPGFAAAAIVTLALGIGANVAIFSVVRAVVLKPPPYRDPSRVVAFLNSRSGGTATIYSSSLPDYEDWKRQLTSFESMGLMSGWTFNITSLELPERVFGARVTGSLFPTLGTPPLIGRGIEPADDQPGGDEVVVLGYRGLAAAVRWRPRHRRPHGDDGGPSAHRDRRDAAAIPLSDGRRGTVGGHQGQHDRHAAQQPVHGGRRPIEGGRRR